MNDAQRDLNDKRQHLIALIRSASSIDELEEMTRAIEEVRHKSLVWAAGPRSRSLKITPAKTARNETSSAYRAMRGNARSVLEPELPSEPPGSMYWTTDRRPGETPPEFVRRIYGGAGYLDQGMTKGQLRRMDVTLTISLNAWIKKHGTPAYLEGRLLTVRQRNDALLNAYAEVVHSADQTVGSELAKLTAALAAAARRRADPRS